jgi:hypothetical protein
MPMKKYHRSLDLLLASAAAARAGKHETAGKLLIKASEDPGLDDAIDDVDDMQEEARVRRSKVQARRKTVKAAEGDMMGEGEDDSLETLLDDVSEAGDGEVSDEELDELVVEEGSDDEGGDGEEDDDEEEMVEASASRRRKIARTASNMSALARLQATLAKAAKK